MLCVWWNFSIAKVSLFDFENYEIKPSSIDSWMFSQNASALSEMWDTATFIDEATVDDVELCSNRVWLCESQLSTFLRVSGDQKEFCNFSLTRSEAAIHLVSRCLPSPPCHALLHNSRAFLFHLMHTPLEPHSIMLFALSSSSIMMSREQLKQSVLISVYHWMKFHLHFIFSLFFLSICFPDDFFYFSFLFPRVIFFSLSTDDFSWCNSMNIYTKREIYTSKTSYWCCEFHGKMNIFCENSFAACVVFFWLLTTSHMLTSWIWKCSICLLPPLSFGWKLIDRTNKQQQWKMLRKVQKWMSNQLRQPRRRPQWMKCRLQWMLSKNL